MAGLEREPRGRSADLLPSPAIQTRCTRADRPGRGACVADAYYVFTAVISRYTYGTVSLSIEFGRVNGAPVA